MSYIYVITNRINGKQYVGKTNSSIQDRWKEHCNDSKKFRCNKRPLYDAMNKYGIENFEIHCLEKCSWKEASIKEIYWIGKLNTYEQGYNATLGGDGKVLYNYKEIADKYKELQNQQKTAEYFNCDVHTVKVACEEYNVPILSSQDIAKAKGKKVLLIELNKVFVSIKDAARFLQEEHYTENKSLGSVSKNIGQVCSGQRKSAYKMHWKFI